MDQMSKQDAIFPDGQPVTALLGRWKSGDRSVEAELIAAVYPYMRAMAKSNLGRLGQGIVQSTELANEAFIRLQSQHQLDWQDRAHFLAVIAAVTRNVVIDMVREQHAKKRGGGELPVSLDNDIDENQFVLNAQPDMFDWIALEEAMKALELEDQMCARVCELKLFSSMEVDEISEVLEISAATIGRHWRFAKTWLARRLALQEQILRD